MRLSKPGNSAHVEAGIWYNAKQDTTHITIKGAMAFIRPSMTAMRASAAIPIPT